MDYNHNGHLIIIRPIANRFSFKISGLLNHCAWCSRPRTLFLKEETAIAVAILMIDEYMNQKTKPKNISFIKS